LTAGQLVSTAIIDQIEFLTYIIHMTTKSGEISRAREMNQIVSWRALFSVVAVWSMTVIVMGGPPTLDTNVGQHAIFPSEGQTAEQQQQDQTDAYDWATSETGWDPYTAYQVLVEQGIVAAETAEATKGQAIHGAARGALVGAAVGAIAGDAGQGAAIGAAAGGLTGGMRSRRTRKSAQSSAEKAKADFQQKFAIWDSYFVAAMEGKGYSVK
jgi:hypothetical protein